jgi:hypothetical protein
MSNSNFAEAAQRTVYVRSSECDLPVSPGLPPYVVVKGQSSLLSGSVELYPCNAVGHIRSGEALIVPNPTALAVYGIG